MVNKTSNARLVPAERALLISSLNHQEKLPLKFLSKLLDTIMLVIDEHIDKSKKELIKLTHYQKSTFDNTLN